MGEEARQRRLETPVSRRLPDFPWDQLTAHAARARAHPDGIVDLSIGTPVDPTPLDMTWPDEAIGRRNLTTSFSTLKPARVPVALYDANVVRALGGFNAGSTVASYPGTRACPPGVSVSKYAWK